MLGTRCLRHWITREVPVIIVNKCRKYHELPGSCERHLGAEFPLESLNQRFKRNFHLNCFAQALKDMLERLALCQVLMARTVSYTYLYSKHLGQCTAKVDSFNPLLDWLSSWTSTGYPNQCKGLKEGTKISKNRWSHSPHGDGSPITRLQTKNSQGIGRCQKSHIIFLASLIFPLMIDM